MAIQKRNPNGTIKSDYGDSVDKRFCPECKTFYPKANFYKDARGTDGLTRRCKQCHARKSYKSRMKRPGITSERYASMRKWTLYKKYGLTDEEFEGLLNEQEGKCKICGESTTAWWTGKANGGLTVDHHHECGKVRGLLCSHCNAALGYFKDDIQRLEMAIIYLKNVRCCEGATMESRDED